MIRLTDSYKPREVMGELLLVPCGTELNTFNGIKTLNSIGREIYMLLSESRTEEEIISAVLDKYDVTSDEASADVHEFINELIEQGVAELTE